MAYLSASQRFLQSQRTMESTLARKEMSSLPETQRTHTQTQRIQISTHTRSEHEENSELSIHVLAVSRSCHNTPWTQVVKSNYLKSILVTQLISTIKPYFLRYVQELSLGVMIVGSECCFWNQKRGL